LIVPGSVRIPGTEHADRLPTEELERDAAFVRAADHVDRSLERIGGERLVAHGA
jgi:hypothetical protein